MITVNLDYTTASGALRAVGATKRKVGPAKHEYVLGEHRCEGWAGDVFGWLESIGAIRVVEGRTPEADAVEALTMFAARAVSP